MVCPFTTHPPVHDSSDDDPLLCPVRVFRYMAPEIVENKGHGFGADWWSLGVFLFEIRSGFTPFSSSSEVRQLRHHLRTVLGTVFATVL